MKPGVSNMTETKRQSAEWKCRISPQPKKTRRVPSKIKTMLITFFDSKGIIHKEFLPSGQTITREYYLTVLKRLMSRIRWISPEYKDEVVGVCCMIMRPVTLRRFLAKNNVCVLNHPPYSPDLAPCDFSLFRKLKMKLKGIYFQDVPTIQNYSTSVLESIPQSEMEQSFESLLNRCKICIESGGDYFE